jgi:tetratricopeptide (TPR) repeat protein
VSALLEVPAFGTLIQLITVLSPGYNGSLLVNGRDQVVGVVTLAGSQNFNVIPMERVVRLTAGPGRTLKDWETKRNDAAERSYSEALGFQQRGDYEKALFSLKQAVSKNPRYAEAHFRMGYCYSQLRRNEEAVEAYREAVRLKPDFVLAHFYLGLAYLDLEDKEGARREYEALKSLDKDYARDLLGLM